jgi:ABC-type nitrate/sulfonate/bicarbonate transport system permease component
MALVEKVPYARPIPAAQWLAAVRKRATRFVTPVLLLIAWELLTRFGDVTDFMLSPPGDVAARLVADVTGSDFAANLGLTLYRTLFGFALALAGGVSLGLAMTRSRFVNWFFDPIISIGFPMPKIAFLPVFILWFGLYDGSKLTIIVLSAIFPIVTATVAGLQGVEREIVWSARSLGASERRVGWEIVLPAALPQILTGAQIALPTALIVTIIAEMMMGGYGLGGAMMEASRMLDSPGVFAGIVEIAVVGHVIISVMALIRRSLLVWHAERQEPTTV